MGRQPSNTFPLRINLTTDLYQALAVLAHANKCGVTHYVTELLVNHARELVPDITMPLFKTTDINDFTKTPVLTETPHETTTKRGKK